MDKVTFEECYVTIANMDSDKWIEITNRLDAEYKSIEDDISECEYVLNHEMLDQQMIDNINCDLRRLYAERDENIAMQDYLMDNWW